ncbi:hypothetical protein PoB_001407900 [Plakobranchus ocellatus]|uniref:Tudor domain-containing protein n=1 Tax=Plakobranchus ocellatus TaxID=259542 RepID=A0AAV3YZK7_9GAST|nr:hypothetical protein PoB_001407900 [Plakobranchus ocellatus]
MDSLHSLKLSEKAPELGDLQPGQMLAVACEDAWYPALVETPSAGGQNVTVSFAQLGKGLGAFRWPDGKDVHPVSRRSILDADLEIEPRAGGRLWVVKNAKNIQEKFKNM